jgi:hypothetical protein
VRTASFTALFVRSWKQDSKNYWPNWNPQLAGEHESVYEPAVLTQQFDSNSQSRSYPELAIEEISSQEEKVIRLREDIQFRIHPLLALGVSKYHSSSSISSVHRLQLSWDYLHFSPSLHLSRVSFPSAVWVTPKPTKPVRHWSNSVK